VQVLDSKNQKTHVGRILSKNANDRFGRRVEHNSAGFGAVCHFCKTALVMEHI
jgi:hypothetical protein